MVSKCANPECRATFRYFHSGQLFRLEMPVAKSPADQGEMKLHMPRVEFFWLCDECAGRMTLTFDKGLGVAVRPKLAHAVAA